MLGRWVTKVFWWLLARGLLPDCVLRWRIRRGLKGLVASIESQAQDYEDRAAIEDQFVTEIKAQPIAVCQQDANQQHYEVPADFFRIVLGPKLKYSCALFRNPTSSLSEAEVEMLNVYTERAGIRDGMDLLDLGCGWGSVALFMASRFKGSKVVALSNSVQQREYIEKQAVEQGLSNLRVVTGDIAVCQPQDFSQAFDRVISIEMFEHMKNYEKLLHKVSTWLKPGGKLFVHIFTHKWKSYHFKDDWMGRTFFTGGTMPSHNLLLYFQGDLRIERSWGVSGEQYARTSEAWLKNMDSNRQILEPILKQTYGDKWARWWLNWRLFFIVVAETFGIQNGSEWGVSHYLFVKPKPLIG